jgi:HEPN domain-containing protein
MGWLEFEETKNVVGGLAYPATHDGYVVYSSLRSPEQVTRDFVQDWLGRASEDLAVAFELMERERTSYDAVGFHAQQAAEEFLKTLLIRYQIPFPKTGNIRRVIELVEVAVPNIRQHLNNAGFSSLYGGETRDPESQLPLNRDAGARAVEMAAHAQVVVMERIADYLKAERPTGDP